MKQKVFKFGKGQELFRQGEKGGELFFIQRGTVELSFYNEDAQGTTRLVRVGPRNVLGTMSFMEGEPRSATAKAETDVECVKIDQSQREQMLKEIPAWFRVLVKDLSSNLRRINARYTKARTKCKILEKRVKILQEKVAVSQKISQGLRDELAAMQKQANERAKPRRLAQ